MEVTPEFFPGSLSSENGGGNGFVGTGRRGVWKARREEVECL
jgi:hypothetical protein